MLNLKTGILEKAGNTQIGNFEEKNLLDQVEMNPIKTGTTIVGVKTNDCVVLAADTRSTSGTFVANKHCLKLHKISDEIYCAGAGTAADTQRVTEYCASMVRIFENKYNKKAPIKYVVRLISSHLFKYGGVISAALIVAARYQDSFHLYSISPDGTVAPGFFLTMGSGSLAAISVLESHYSLQLQDKEVCELAANAVKAGILNDLYSGSNVDIVYIGKKETTLSRSFLGVAETMKGREIKYDKHSIKITKEEIWNYIEEVNE